MAPCPANVCREIVTKLIALDDGGTFAEPVPDDIPYYNEHLALIGSQRMDLGTMKKQTRRYKVR